MSSINEAINTAQEAAGKIVEDAEVTQETLPAQNGQPAQVIPFEKPSMETMGNSTGIASSVDEWLKVNEDGIKVGDKKGLTDSVKVRINMVEDDGFFVKQSIKWGNPINYASTYDGRVSDKGGPWGNQLQQVQAMDPRAKPFPSADIKMTLVEPLKLKDVTIPAGTTLGHTLSMSNWGNWAEFFREVSKAEKIGQEVEVSLGAEEINGKNGYTWGVLTFSLAA